MGGHAGAALRVMTSASSWRCNQVYDGRLDQVAEVRAFLRKVLDGYPVADDAILLASELQKLKGLGLDCPDHGRRVGVIRVDG